MKPFFFFLLVLHLAAPIALNAHPHMFLDDYLEFVADEAGILGVRETWVFEADVRDVLARLFDSDSDGTLNATEVENIRAGFFDAVKRYHYFTRILIDGKEYGVAGIEEFAALLESDRLVYSFFVPLRVVAGPEPVELEVAVVDNTGYVACALRDLRDPNSTPGTIYDVRILFDFAVYSATNPLGSPYVRLRIAAAQKTGKAQGLRESPRVLPIEELPPLPEPSNDNPFLFDQSLIRMPSAINPFYGS